MARWRSATVLVRLARGPARFGVRLARGIALFGFAVSLFGCGGHAAHTVEARRALDRHDPQAALALYNEQLEVSSGSELPTEQRRDTPLYLLDRSLISQQLDAFKDSSQDLETADKQIEMLDFSRSSAHEIGRYLFSDDTGPYKARPYEKLLINTMNMLNYLVRGDLSGAKIEARRLAVMQKYLSGAEEDDPTAALLGPGSYLAGFTFEMARDYDEALRYYDEALRFAPYASLEQPIQRVATFSGYRSPRLAPIVARGKGERAAGTGEVLVLVGYGRVPALRAERLPVGLALTLAGMHLDPGQNQAARRLAGQGLVTWVNYPTLESAPHNYAPPGVQVDGSLLAVDGITDVEALVRSAFEKQKGALVASALTRLITRGAVGAGAGVGVARATDNAALGMLAALVTQATLTAVDTPDTRCWATLPARIAVARAVLPAGRHVVRISAQGVTRERTVDLAESGFVVVNLTELSQY